MISAKRLHQMLVLACEQFNLDVIQGYLQGRQSVFKDLSSQLVVFGTIVSPCCVAQPGLLSSCQLPRYGEEATAEVAVKSIGMLEGQHFYLGVFSQKVGANDDVKGFVYSTLQCCITDLLPRQIATLTPAGEPMVRPSPTVMATVLVFSKVFSRRRATIESVGPVSRTARKT